MSVGIELLVKSWYEDKTLSIIRTHCNIKAAKRKKLPKRQKRPPTSWLLSPPLFKKSVGISVNEICNKKALSKSLAIFKL
jgi:hypothetical protein